MPGWECGCAGAGLRLAAGAAEPIALCEHSARPREPPPCPTLPPFAHPALQEWDRKWKNKRLRLKHPDTGKELEVRVSARSSLGTGEEEGGGRLACLPASLPQATSPPPRTHAAMLPDPTLSLSLSAPHPQVVDTCDDDDCDGCCTANAAGAGGLLIDLEWNTAERFWGKGDVRGVSKLEFQVLED